MTVSRRSFLSFAGMAIAPGIVGGDAWAQSETDEAIALIRNYYAAINARRYRTAFNNWWGAESGVLPNGQTYATFKSGFRQTASVKVMIGTPGEIEGAAGSSFIEIPVKVRARLMSGSMQRFAGSYTLRKANLPPEDGGDRGWRIHSGSLRRVS